MTLETWPGAEINGTLSRIAPKATASGSGVASYEVRVALGSNDLPVRIGMTADADLITSEKNGVLLVPSQAVTADREAGKYYVNRAGVGPDGARTFTRTEVTIGLKDGNNTEITSGLHIGDEVLIGEITTAAPASSRPGFFPPMPGDSGQNNPFGG